ncbi:MAG: bifunctional diaminohydroxyphosphoribosylaminopyrimidine deaminase/5-amino-6-(5-phosphoribosylamino)uracil reductase RibD [Sphingomonadaceae bacterium]|nr:bifunctional diaminohydroxyphosphoribosylaminopyrimidine deaminase/5-amino-6-(5-phosphoribosylamino)uracil reductase RibD [Sphingomonadaceae bacterium]
MGDDERWIDAALALAGRGIGRTSPNPSVGCLIVKQGRVIGRGWTQPGGRPHAEAMALAQAGDAAHGATAYVTLEPCAHVSARGPACADGLVAAGVSRVVAAMVDPDARTAGQGFDRLRAAGIEVMAGIREAAARRPIEGFLTRQALGRPFVTLKLAMSVDGRIAMADGRSRWITGEAARAHAHLLRARSDLIVVGRGTLEADDPALDVRLPGLEDRSPRIAVMSRSLRAIPADRKAARPDSLAIEGPAAIDGIDGINDVLVEGGAGVAAAFLAADRVDRLVVYRAPIVIGDGRAGVGDIGLAELADAHGRWRAIESRRLGNDGLEVYDRTR